MYVVVLFYFILCAISEWLFRNATDLIVEGGYKEAGYEYVIIDDCWMEWERDPNTKELVPDRKRFPSGMKALADYVSNIIYHTNLWHYFHGKQISIVCS